MDLSVGNQVKICKSEFCSVLTEMFNADMTLSNHRDDTHISSAKRSGFLVLLRTYIPIDQAEERMVNVQDFCEHV